MDTAEGCISVASLASPSSNETIGMMVVQQMHFPRQCLDQEQTLLHQGAVYRQAGQNSVVALVQVEHVSCDHQ